MNKLCDTCHSKGAVIGKDVYHEKKITCRKCNGNKVVTCYDCRGTTKRKCNMGHEHDCITCKDGKVTCVMCASSGVTVERNKSLSMSWVPAYPDQRGSKACPSCNGKGVVKVES